ncbi:phycobiliprotein lyase [Prochlorococcus marinus]|uniref:Chromophore lyase CpcS/CpeS n=1 Tax=Prochlorococcus marinus (strain MIT 9211) TaxID=93059 RepID=A9BDV9_PROM4|nr:phycobiliprotein lyase [Prochlorococcus marinus]ABX08269.1 phycoerythrin linker protein CpeS-like protein [Prochlorococcus marinus str. MIT 9211]
MNIEQFVAQSLGEWKAMRSSHSLAFKQFEEIISKIIIKPLDINDSNIQELIEDSIYKKEEMVQPFQIEWQAESNWEEDSEQKDMKGSSILIPILRRSKNGIIIRSIGYTEKVRAISYFKFLEDGTMILSTQYNQSTAEERIWFISNSVRCRSSVVRSKDSSAILQTSFSSEVKLRGNP